MSNASLESKNLFTSPHAGTCWSSVAGPVGNAKEPLPMIACLFDAILGLVGLFLSRNVTAGGKILYSVLFGYGLATFCFHLTLWEGFYRMLDVQLNFLQAINIVYMGCILKEEGLYFKIRSFALILFFSVYPFFAHVLGITLNKSWISWITFDGIWVIAFVGILIIWCKRDSLGPSEHPHIKAVFNLVWNVIICVVLAYFFWLIDEVVCVQQGNANAAFVIFGFYYMTTLTVFLRANNLGLYPKVLIWPRNKPFAIFIAVQYEKPISNEEMS
jgi:hypothetical protein